MNEKTYGYVRVSSKDQNTDRQLIAVEDGVFRAELPPLSWNVLRVRTAHKKQDDRLLVGSIVKLGWILTSS